MGWLSAGVFGANEVTSKKPLGLKREIALSPTEDLDLIDQPTASRMITAGSGQRHGEAK
jgi:hypothetical protein